MSTDVDEYVLGTEEFSYEARLGRFEQTKSHRPLCGISEIAAQRPAVFEPDLRHSLVYRNPALAPAKDKRIAYYRGNPDSLYKALIKEELH